MSAMAGSSQYSAAPAQMAALTLPTQSVTVGSSADSRSSMSRAAWRNGSVT
jgi:hypothetical protein